VAGRSSRKSSFKQIISDFLFGAFMMAIHRDAVTAAVRYKDALGVCLFGGAIGMPVMNSYFSIRLAPLIVGEVSLWKRRMLRERDPMEQIQV